MHYLSYTSGIVFQGRTAGRRQAIAMGREGSFRLKSIDHDSRIRIIITRATPTTHGFIIYRHSPLTARWIYL